MKAKFLLRFPKLYGALIMVFLWTSFSLNAQCPTITNPTPPPICDASGYTFGDLSSDYVTDGGDGIVWYDALTGGNIIYNNQLVLEGTYYVDDNSGSCVTRQSIIVNFQVQATGENLDQIYCSNQNATVQTYIDDVLAPEIPSGGSVEVYNDYELTDLASPLDAIPSDGKRYYVVFVDNSGCKGQIEVGPVAVYDTPANPQPTSPQTFCADTNPTVADLDPGTTDTNYSWYANVDGSGNPIQPGLNATTPLIDGATYYVQVNSSFCASEAIPVVVQIDQPVNAGTSATLDYCNDNLPASAINLFDELTGSPDTTGSWSGPFTTTNGYQGTVDISGLTATGTFTFTYTVTSAGVCPNDTSTVTINVYETLSPGNASAQNTASFCVSQLPTDFDLFTLIENYDTGGQWTLGTTSSDPVVSSPIDLSSFTAATYNFTYTQNLAPSACIEASTTVQIVVVDDPNAGNAVNQTFCENELGTNSPFDLFDALDSSQDNNSGTWTDASNATISNSLDLTALTVSGSPYTFNYTIDNGVCSDTEPITITIEPAPESGTANTPEEFCEGSAPSNYNLFDMLTGEDQTGTWLDDDATGTLVGNEVDLSNLTPATYNFTYDVDAIGSCDDTNVTVSIVINPLPITGTPSPASFCENDLASNSPLNLFDQLSGEDAGGTWSDDDTTNALSGSDLDLTSLGIGTYNFTYSITDANTCTNSTTVTITIDDAPESGTANTPVEFCEGSAPSNYDLFDMLTGEDQTGTWLDDDATGTLVGNEVDLSNLTPATYNFTYDVDAIGSCDDVDVTVSIVINPLPNTGTPTPATFCENDLASNSPLNLFDQLSGEDAGGTWSDDDTTGALSGSDLDLTRLGIGTYNFTYSITDANTCSDSSTVTVTINDAPESGEPNGIHYFCEDSAPASYNLFSMLNFEDQTGTWSDDDATGVLVDNTVNLSNLEAGTYNFTYDVDAVGSCDDDDVTVSIVIDPLPNTGTATPITFCANELAANSPFDLFDQLAGEDGGGTWFENDSSGALSDNELDLTSLTVGVYDFEYVIAVEGGCLNYSIVTVTINQAPESGIAGAPATYCLSEITAGQTLDLFDLLSDEDSTGTWSDDDATGELTDNILALDELGTGTYNFTFDVNSVGSCDDQDVTVSVIINDITAPTANATQEFCDSATVADLVATGNNIQWYANASGGTALDAATQLVDAQMYYASQTDETTGCESATRTAVTATIYQSPEAGSASVMPILACNDNAAIDLFTGLDGSQDSGGTWSNDDGVGVLTGNMFNATGVMGGTYSFTYLVTATAPCVDDSITISVTIEEPLSAGSDGAPLDLCSNNGTVDLFAQLGGTPDTGGVWSPVLNSGTGVFDPLIDAPGTYIYSLSNACGTVSSSIEVMVTLAPNAGSDNSISLCVVDDAVDLFTLLGPDAQSGGTWSPALTSGTGVFDPAVDFSNVYSYTVTAQSPCADDAIAEITVTVNDSPAIIVENPNPEFCLIDNPTVADLSTSIRPSGTVNWYEDADLTIPLLETDALVDGEDYFATQTNTSGCESSVAVEINVTVNDAETPTLTDPTIEYCINDGPTIATLSENISFDNTVYELIWYDAASGGTELSSSTELETDTTYYAAFIDLVSGCESSSPLSLTPELTACGKLNLPDGFSPNGDGVNDTFELDNLDVIYPDFEIEIYNRNGNLVYKGNASTPRFNGISNQSRVMIKGELPVGVYFYIFKYNDGEHKPVQGRLYLSR